MLRLQGASNDEIAAELGYANRSVTWKLIQSAIREIKREPAEAVLQLELTRLDAMLLGVWSKAKTGDIQAINSALRIMERRAAYLGLDQPKGLKVEMARELEGFLERLKGALEPDVYERVLAVAAGIDGPPKAVGVEVSEAPGADGEDDKPDDA
jgi:hypothetical protein